MKFLNFFKDIFDCNENIVNPGAIEDRPDPRDYKWDEFSAEYAPFDWSRGYDVEVFLRKRISQPTFALPVKDQGNTGSCGGQAWASFGSVVEGLSTNTFEDRSAKFIYSQTYVNIPGGGSAGRDNCKLVQKQGWGLESLTPSYENGLPPSEGFIRRNQDITDVARQKASEATALTYANAGVDIDSVAQAMAANNGIILGVVGINNGTWKSVMPAPLTNQELNSGFTWRHWVYAGKAITMSNGKRAIGILNSWGPNVGDRGWQWLTEDHFKYTSIFSSWTLIYNQKVTIPTEFKYQFNTNMQYGDTSGEVKMLQTALQYLGHFPATLNPTGFYGSITANAVYKFQTSIVNGVQRVSVPDRNHAGPKTRAALNLIFG